MIVCQAGDVSFWSLEGQKTKRFNDQDASETIDTTCLGFDELGEKFYTGGSDGKIRVSSPSASFSFTRSIGFLGK